MTRESRQSEKEVRKGRIAGKSSFMVGHPLAAMLVNNLHSSKSNIRGQQPAKNKPGQRKKRNPAKLAVRATDGENGRCSQRLQFSRFCQFRFQTNWRTNAGPRFSPVSDFGGIVIDTAED